MLDLIAKSTQKDIETLENIDKEYSGDEYTYDALTDMLGRLRSQETNTAELISRFHENDLPPIRSTDTEDQTSPSQNDSPRFPQDSSDVHQTDFNSFDPFGEE